MTPTYYHDPRRKMRLIQADPPSVDEIEEAFSEAAATSQALDEEDLDELEREELQHAHRKAVGRVRLNLYRLGRDPEEELRS